MTGEKVATDRTRVVIVLRTVGRAANKAENKVADMNSSSLLQKLDPPVEQVR